LAFDCKTTTNQTKGCIAYLLDKGGTLVWADNNVGKFSKGVVIIAMWEKDGN
jgi:hypothetical protein